MTDCVHHEAQALGQRQHERQLSDHERRLRKVERTIGRMALYVSLSAGGATVLAGLVWRVVEHLLARGGTP